MEKYHDLLQDALTNGIKQENRRTNRVCSVLVGQSISFDVREGFPAVTSKKLAFKNAKGELLGFFNGVDNAADFRALGCGVWDQNANETKAWLENPARKGHDDLGRIYSKQWVDWKDRRIAQSAIERDAMLAKGYEIEVADEVNHKYAMVRSINQLEKVLTQLLTDCTDRRMIISAWNPAELDLMALPPCHMDYRFVAFEDSKELHLVMTIRSWDLFLGAPFNICNTALLLEIMARLSGFTAATITIQATNAHIYWDDHKEQVKEQLSRDHKALPTLHLSGNIKKVSLDEVKGAFTRIKVEDIELIGYESHASIKAPMAA